MKTCIKMVLISAALTLTACAHERTEMDRELALKLVDKAGRIEIVQTGGSPLLGPAQGPMAYQQTPQQANVLNQNDGLSHNCRSQPIYDLNGVFTRMSVVCY